MNRREAVARLSLIGAAAVTRGSWAAAPSEMREESGSWDGAVPQGKSGSLCAVIHDERYSDARRFAEALKSPGVMRLASTGEAIALWTRECRPRLPQRAWRLAGLTTYSDFVLLRACARESGGGLLYESLHDCRRGGRIVHAVRAGGSIPAIARALRDGDWAARLARVLAYAPLSTKAEEARIVRVAGCRPADDHPGTLASWVIGWNGRNATAIQSGV